MKRSFEDVRPSDLNRTWSGLNVAGLPVDPPKASLQFHPTQRLVNDGIQLKHLTCDYCAELLPATEAHSCHFCDAGPLHRQCLLEHICEALPTALLAPRGGDFRDAALLNETEEERGFSFSDAEDEEPECETGSQPSDAESPLGAPVSMPKFLSEQQMQQGFKNARPASASSPHLGAGSRSVQPGDSAEQRWRSTQPPVRPYTRGDRAKVREVESCEEKLSKALLEFENDKFAPSNLASVQSRVLWWNTRSAQLGESPYPLDTRKINLIGALLKAGCYRSSPQYFSCFKRQHVCLGHEWTDQLALAVKDALRSITRGMGPEKRCPALDLREVGKIEEIDPVPQGPYFPKSTVIFFAHFAAREMEAALRQRCQITFHEGKGCGVVAMYLPSSKTDPAGAGVLRRQGCSCGVNADLCPVAHARRIYEFGTRNGASDNDPFLNGSSLRTPPTKPAMVDTFRKVAGALGWNEESCRAVTGHLLRATGAQYFARCGVDYWKIQLFCRWSTHTILKYLRDLPLEESESWVTESAGRKHALDEILLHTSEQVCAQHKSVRVKDVERIVNTALQSYTSEVLLTFEKEKSDILEMIDSLKTQKLALDDVWAAELSRRFLPKFVKNFNSRTIHAVRDEMTSGCGFEWRNSKECILCNSIEEGFHKCEKAGCSKLFVRDSAAS